MLKPGQTAIVTGAGSGIGRAIACALAARGLVVTLVGREEAKLHAAARDAGPAARVLAADVTAERGRGSIAEAAGEALGVLVHSAGTYERGGLIDFDAAALRRMLDVNLEAPLRLSAACLAPLRQARGQVVFINSSAALPPGRMGMLGYAASKAALRAAADAVRAELNAHGVRVLSVFPGRTDTPMQAAILAAEGRSAARGALLAPEDVAAMVLAALTLPTTAEVTEIMARPMRPL